MTIDNKELEVLLKQVMSDSDSDAVMGLRGLQALFKESGAPLHVALRYAADNIAAYAKTDAGAASPAAKAERAPVSVSGMPQCISQQKGHIDLIPPGQTAGTNVALPGLAAETAEAVAGGLKDALVAAVINKSRFKLKVVDVKNGRGEVTETLLQAEYDREGMTAVRVWSNVKGEVAALAAVLRKAVATAFPDLTL